MLDSLIFNVCRTRQRRLWVGLALGALVLVGDLGQRHGATPDARAAWPGAKQAPASGVLTLQAHGDIPMPFGTPAAHASTLVAMPEAASAALTAFWFAGERESAPDVQIAASQFDRATQQWTPAHFVVNRADVSAQLGFGVRRLGNPVAWLDQQGRIHLFVVATGLGGWAAARIAHLRQTGAANGVADLSFEALRSLPLSWLWNTSFLVRTAPLALQDGGMVLPVHFELGIKYPVALRFDAQGEFMGMVRMSRRKYVLQPTLLMASETHWLALMRDQRPQGKVTAAQSLDGGQSWGDLPDLALDNPDASIAGLGLAPGHMLLAHNSSPGSRNTLDLSRSVTGHRWAVTQRLEDGHGKDEFSYPAMVWADRSVWVSYTDQRERIAWQRFAWQPASP